MLMPKRVKHRKVMRGRMSGLAKGGHTVAFGEYGLATHGAGLDHQPPDRGRPAGDDPLGQARRQDLDPDLPRQAGHQEAGRDPDGLRQGRARPLGRGRQARPDPVRDGRRRRRPRRVEAMRLASHKLPVQTRVVVREGSKEAAWPMDIDTSSGRCPTPSSRRPSARRSRSSGRPASPSPPASSRTTARIPQTRRTIARILTVQHERQARRPDGVTGDHAMTGAQQ